MFAPGCILLLFFKSSSITNIIYVVRNQAHYLSSMPVIPQFKHVVILGLLFILGHLHCQFILRSQIMSQQSRVCLHPYAARNCLSWIRLFNLLVQESHTF